MTRRSAVTAGLVAAVVVGGAIAAAIGFGGGTPEVDRPAPPATVPITRQTLVDSIEAQGELGFGTPVPLRYIPPTASDAQAAGTGRSDAAGPVPACTARSDAARTGRSDTTGPVPATRPSPTGGTGPIGGSDRPVPTGQPTPPAPVATGAPSDPPAEDDQGLITWLPPVGAIIGRGGTLLRVDDRPVPLLIGVVPVYRTVRTGLTGPDVAQLERNLAALGYGGFTVDRAFTASTAAAVRAWQRATGQRVTGVLAPGDAVYAPAPIRIAAEPARVGDAASGEILDYTGTVRMVTVDLPVAEQQYAAARTTVTVELPDGRTLDGAVDGAPVPVTDANGQPAVRATVTIADPAALGSTAPAQVTVHLVTERRPDVLTVPVTALVALAEGGYGVQLDDHGTLRYVAVTTGLFAAGRVEINGPDVRAGALVVVPR